jgi:hypothetical protein
MKKTILSLIASIPIFLVVGYTNREVKLPYGFVNGTPEIKSISSIAFGPSGVLFIGDSKSASIFAIETKDAEAVEKAASVEIKNIDQRIAAFLGTEAKNVTIQDLKVNPVSKKIYCAVQSANGSSVLLKFTNGKIEAVPLKDIGFSSISLNNAPPPIIKDQSGRERTAIAIADLDYSDGKVMVSGISNQEFGSTFRSISFPFTKNQDQSSLEIYHAAHGKFETHSPIQTFTTAELNGKKYLVASYTCTPLVLFSMDQLKPGTHVKGRTVAEFGAGNRPLDMINMKKGNDLFLIIANSNRPVMKVKYKDIETFEGALTTPVNEPYSSAGVPYVSFPWVNVLQLDKLDDTQFVLLQRSVNGDLNLRSQTNQAL